MEQRTDCKRPATKLSALTHTASIEWHPLRTVALARRRVQKTPRIFFVILVPLSFLEIALFLRACIEPRLGFFAVQTESFARYCSLLCELLRCRAQSACATPLCGQRNAPAWNMASPGVVTDSYLSILWKRFLAKTNIPWNICE